MIREQDFAAALGDYVEVRGTHESLQAGEAGLGADQIEALLGRPQSCEFCVVNENVGGTGGVRTVFEIQDAAVQEERGAIGVEEDRRCRVVVALDDQSAFGQFQQHIGNWARRKIGIEHDHSHASCVEKQNHH